MIAVRAKWQLAAWLLGLGALAACPSPAWAERKGHQRPPVLSPSRALAGGRSRNLFNIIQPTLETRAALARQEGEIGKLNERMSQRTTPGLTAAGEFEVSLARTGHRVFFSNTSHYYP